MPAYHVGVLVRDIAEARRRFAAVLGISFGPVEPRVLNYADGEADEVMLCYSVEGPPYLELIEANGSGLFGLQHPEGVHHIGAWVTDGSNHCAALGSQGVSVDRQLQAVDGPYGRSENFVWFNAPGDLHGVRFEFVDDSMRAALEDRFRSSNK
ncbi:MAG TPA: VOC family protein [Acidimicrobiales bacterium]|nr:VOC family protein [Acidimicrobiales bacterium]